MQRAVDWCGGPRSYRPLDYTLRLTAMCYAPDRLVSIEGENNIWMPRSFARSAEHTVGYLEGKVTRELDAGTHTIFMGEVKEDQLFKYRNIESNKKRRREKK